MADCSTFDVLVVDWLYDDLDPAEAARFSRHVDGCAACGQAAESLIQVRALMRALPEEEPPAAISARVLREAARAVSQQERGLAQVSAWITGALGRAWAHPAAAAVASLVLVAGVAGALFARDRLEMAAPRVDSAAVHREGARGQGAPVAGTTGASETSAAASAPAMEPVPPSGMARGASDDRTSGRARLAEGRAQLGEKKIAAEREPRKPVAKPAQRVDRQLERGLAAQAGDAEEQTASLAQNTTDEALRDSPGDLDGAGYAGGAGSAGKEPQAPEAAPRPEATRAAPAVTAAPAAPEPDGLDKSERAPRTSRRKADTRAPSWVESRHTDLRAALSDKQCIRAVGIADDIQGREPGYYQSQVAGSKELAACRTAARKAAKRAGTSGDRARQQGAGDAPEAGDAPKSGGAE